MEYMKGRRIMELNPESPVIAKLKEQFEADPVGGAAKATAELLYETALVTSGFDVESPKDFAGRWAFGMSLGTVCRRSRVGPTPSDLLPDLSDRRLLADKAVQTCAVGGRDISKH